MTESAAPDNAASPTQRRSAGPFHGALEYALARRAFIAVALALWEIAAATGTCLR